MIRQFKAGGVYKCYIGSKEEEICASFLIKVVGLDRTIPFIALSDVPCRSLATLRDSLHYRIFGNTFFGHPQAMFKFFELVGGKSARVRTVFITYGYDEEMARLFEDNDNYGLISSERVIFKTEVLLFCATKLIVLARRAKERMYAPGGIGFIAAEESFDRAAKAIYENFEQADRDAKRQCIE